jgi:hypothetical protein
LTIKDGGRKMKEINPDKEKIVIQAYMIHRMGARRLEKIIENNKYIGRTILGFNMCKDDIMRIFDMMYP